MKYRCPKALSGSCKDIECSCWSPHSHDDVTCDSLHCQWPDFEGEWREQEFECVAITTEGE
jgi:hypothetical protein